MQAVRLSTIGILLLTLSGCDYLFPSAFNMAGNSSYKSIDRSVRDQLSGSGFGIESAGVARTDIDSCKVRSPDFEAEGETCEIPRILFAVMDPGHCPDQHYYFPVVMEERGSDLERLRRIGLPVSDSHNYRNATALEQDVSWPTLEMSTRVDCHDIRSLEEPYGYIGTFQGMKLGVVPRRATHIRIMRIDPETHKASEHMTARIADHLEWW